MGSEDVTYQEIEIPILGADEGIDKRILPAGKFVSVINGDYVKPGTIRKRPGITRRVTGLTGGMQGDRIVKWNNQIFVADPDGTVHLRQINQNNGTYATLDTATPVIPTATIRQHPIVTDLTQNQLADHALTSNGFLVYAIIGLGQDTSAIIRVIEIATNAIVLERQVTLAHPALWVRVAASGEQVLVTFSDRGVPPPATPVPAIIHGLIVDCATNEPLLILGPIDTTIDIVSDESSSFPVHDSVGFTVTTGRWAILYRQAGALPNALVLFELIYSGGTITPGTLLAFPAGNAPSHFSMVLANNGHDIGINWRNADIEWRYEIRDETTFATVLAPTIWMATSSSRPALTSAIGRYPNDSGSDNFVMFASESRDTTDLTPITYWVNGSRTGTLASTGPFSKRRIAVMGKPWVRGNRQHIWCITRQGNTNTDIAYTAVMVSVPNNLDDFTIHTAGARQAQIETSAFPESAAPYFMFDTASFLSGAPIMPTAYSLDSNGVYRSIIGIEYVPLEQRTGVIEVQTRYDHLGRYTSAEFGGSTYISGGTILEWDGFRAREVGTVHAPALKYVVSGTSGAWPGSFTSPQQFQYLVVYEYVDSQTQRHHFLRSNVITVQIVSATDEVVLSIDPLTLTRTSQGLSINADTPRVYMTIYRTATDGGTVFQRLFKYSDTPDELINNPYSQDYIIYTDDGTHDNSALEVLYTEGGELENDMVYGGGTALCVHKDRLWIGGGIDPEIVWYSKPRADGTPAEFSIAQTLRVPGEEIVALGSLDDTLIVFCTKGVYAIAGDGPDINGAGRPFDPPSMLNQDSACNGPRSITQIPQGLIFQTRNGLFLLDRSRSITYIGEPIKDTIKLYPIVRGTLVDSIRGEALFALSDVSGTAGTVVSYNYLQGMWALWNHKKRTTTIGSDDEIITTLVNDSTPWADISNWLDREPVYLAQNGNLYESQYNESYYADDLLFYPLDVETGWLSFGRIQGYKRIRKAGILMERFDLHGLEISMKYGYKEDFSTTIAWTQAQIDAMGAVEWLRITVPRQKTPAIRLRVKETEGSASEVGGAADTRGYALDSFLFQIGTIGGMHRLPATQSG